MKNDFIILPRELTPSGLVPLRIRDRGRWKKAFYSGFSFDTYCLTEAKASSGFPVLYSQVSLSLVCLSVSPPG